MHDNHERRRGGPGLGLLLLIPAAVIIAKGASRRRAMWHSGWAGPGGGQPDASNFRLPPRLEWMLETWHTRAHQQAESAESKAV